jgi:hypothetical protein
MAGVSDYERSLIDAVLGQRDPRDPRDPQPRIEPGLALVLLPFNERRERLQQVAIDPALRRNHLNVRGLRVVFDDETPLPIVADWLDRAEVVIADVSELNAAVLYLLGLCHGLRRCPILLAAEPHELPFDLGALRCLRYRDDDRESLYELRENLARALRVFLAASRPRQQRDADENAA